MIIFSIFQAAAKGPKLPPRNKKTNEYLQLKDKDNIYQTIDSDDDDDDELKLNNISDSELLGKYIWSEKFEYQRLY